MNTILSKTTQRGLIPLILLSGALVFSGCGGGGGGSISAEPSGVAAYDFGYEAGFADNAEYFLGYDDSFDNDSNGPSLYQGDLIPFLDEITYDAGFWDGQFEAYNDGYFVAYRFAFIIGFSEGYDNAYWADYLDFLANDLHVELLHAGFRDGYNDGFSEGRIFGAYDYEAFWSFDWLNAFLDWESGTDLYFSEVDKGTGAFGPVILYEWGQNPFTLSLGVSQARSNISSANRMRMISSAGTRAVGPVSTIDAAREFTLAQEALLNVTPGTTSRTNRPLTLTTTWRERIDSYQQQPLFSASRNVTRTRTGERVAE